MVASTHEIFLITQRYLIIKRKNNFLTNIKLRYYVPFIFLAPLLLASSFYMAIQLYPVKNSHLFYWSRSEFGESLFFKVYSIVTILPESLMLVFTLAVVNILTVRAFIKYSKYRSKLLNKVQISKEKSKIKFTRIISILTIFHIITGDL